jgi:NADPH:quinone reductase-like Zn-dependent oxidoreductase
MYSAEPTWQESGTDRHATAGTVTTDAWVLHRGDEPGRSGRLTLEEFEFPTPGEHEVLARPLYGAWEGNMDHALRRSPIDVCELRGEDRVVLGNAGVVEVIDVGMSVSTVRPGDIGIVFCNGVWDEHGYPIRILGYDAPGTMGVLARRMKLHEKQLVVIERDNNFSLAQWAAFSLRYVTAWANWQVAWGCFRAQLPEVPASDVHVWGWGGGVALAELVLAQKYGCRTAMVASTPKRLAQLRSLGISPVDRSEFRESHFERDFLDAVQDYTDGRGVSIFVDNLGVHPNATLKALGREGVITTSGWKFQTRFPIQRAMECQSRHLHVFTHYARHAEGQAAVAFALENGWLPPLDGHVYAWEEIPRLAEEYAAGRIDSYFPIFAVHGQ